jgi:N4-gp56 family major capsid protein
MSASADATLLTNLIDPEVLADYVDKKLVNAIRMAPLAVVDNTLTAKAGDTIKLPSYSYVGDASAVSEGQDIPIAQLTASATPVTVSKIGKAVEISDEAIISGYGNVVEEAGKQILTAINSGIENALLTNMASSATLTKSIAADADPADAIADALVRFGEDIDGDKVLVVDPVFYARLRKADAWIAGTDVAANLVIKGVVGMIHGCQVICSNRMMGNGTYTGYIVKPGALRIFYKRHTLIEFDRDKLAQLNYIIGSNIFAPYVYDTSKLIKLNIENGATT